MMEFRIGEALDRVRRAATGNPPDTVGQPETKPQVVAPIEASKPETKPDTVGQGEQPTGPALSLAERAAQFPRDADRWETLLHNAWMTDPWWYWTLATLRLGGCQIVLHIEAGWALRYDAAAVDELRRKTGDGMLFGSEAEYRELAARALAPRRGELTELLQLSSFGRLVDEDFSWAFGPAGKRRVG